MTRTTLGNTASNYKTDDNSHNGDDTDSTYSDVDTVQSSLCCLQGCLAASAVGFAFFVGLPSGILLVFYASNIKDDTLLVVGACLIVLPVITLLAFVIACLYKHRFKRLASNRVINAKNARKETEDDNSKY